MTESGLEHEEVFECSRVRCRVVKVKSCYLVVTTVCQAKANGDSNYCNYEELTLCFLFFDSHEIRISPRSITLSDLPEVQKAVSLPAEICPQSR